MPGYASHYIGVGGFVVSKDWNKILSVQEKKPMIPGLWKLPGGLVEPGETIAAAVIREVFEETGVKTKFVSILGFREILKYKFE